MADIQNWKDNERFCKIYPKILNVEGGYVNNPKDKGGPTNHGVAYNYHAGRLKQFGILGPQDMPKLTKEQAIEFFYRYLWLPSQADEIPDSKLSLVYWDHAVNAGIGAADSLLAKLPNQKFWYYEGDGKNVPLFWGLTTWYMGLRNFSYTSFKQWGDFGKGWVNRLGIILQDLSGM